MKITDLKLTETYYIPCEPQQDAITSVPGVYPIAFCQVFTDEGVTGLVPAPPGNLAKAIIEEGIKPYVIGENPLHHERIWSRMYWGMLVSGRRGAAVNAIGVVRCGGLTEFLKIAALADAYGLPVCPHNSPLTDVPVVAAVPNGLFHEHVEEMSASIGRMVKDRASPERGMVVPLDKPGFGIELDPEAVERYRNKPVQRETRRTTVRGWRWPPYL